MIRTLSLQSVRHQKLKEASILAGRRQLMITLSLESVRYWKLKVASFLDGRQHIMRTLSLESVRHRKLKVACCLADMQHLTRTLSLESIRCWKLKVASFLAGRWHLMITLSLESVRHWKLKEISFLADRWHLMITLITVVGWRKPVHGNAEGIKVRPLDLFFSADQVDGTQHLLQLPPGALNNSPGDPDLSQDEVIDYGHHDNLQLSALQEYLSLIDNEDSEGEM